MMKKFAVGSCILFCTIGLALIVLTGCYNDKADLIIPNNDCDTTVVISYQDDVVKILEQNCYSCHGADKFSVSGGNHQLDTYESLQKMVENGKLLKAINHA